MTYVRFITMCFIAVGFFVLGARLAPETRRIIDKLDSCEVKLAESNRVRKLKTAQIDALLDRTWAIKENRVEDTAKYWEIYKNLGDQITKTKESGASAK